MVDSADVQQMVHQRKQHGYNAWLLCFRKILNGQRKIEFNMVMESKLLKEHNSKLMILVKGTRALAKGVAASLKMKSIYFTDVELLAGLALKSLAATGTDLYNVLSEHEYRPVKPKVLQVEIGAHFYIPIITSAWELIANYLRPNSGLYLVTNRTYSLMKNEVPCSIFQ